jgi:hypothetical protein
LRSVASPAIKARWGEGGRGVRCDLTMFTKQVLRPGRSRISGAPKSLIRSRMRVFVPYKSMRCLKRHLSNVVFRRLVADAGIEMAA